MKTKCPRCGGTGMIAATRQSEIQHIIGYLNERTNSRYRPTSRPTQAHIIARFNEGACLADFRLVIDHMGEKWGHDHQMSRFLRPQTLFGPKFESYLSDATRHKAQSNQPKLAY